MLLTAAVFLSTSGLFIKLISWQPLAILSGRSLLAAIVFFVYLAYQRQLTYRWTRLQVVGAVAYVSTQLLFIMATKLTTAADAIFLQYAAPLYVVLLGYWFLGERPQRADLLTMPVIFLGMLLFFGQALSFEGMLGNILAVLSGVTMAVMIVCLRAQKGGVPANTIMLGNIIGFLVGLPFLLQETFAASDVAIIVYLGLFQLGIPFLMYTAAVRQLQALETALIVSLEPILNPIWVFLVLDEVPGQLALLGGALVVGAVAVRAFISARATEEDVQLAS